MAKNEIVNVITIKTEESQQTIKGLKKEIADLKKSLDTAVIGSDEFERASKELAMAQAELKTVMADGKKTTDNMEGSYNHLVATMAELKKQWKATADEVKRNELGQQIDNINNQLKELDGTIGNNQRLVGSYAEEFKKALGESDDATIRTRTQLESVQKVTAGLANGYAAVQGAMTLLNIENENLQKAMVKVQSAMAIAQGVGGMKDLVEGLSRGKVAFQGALNGCKAFIGGLNGVKGAIIGTGIGALVVAVGLLIANWDKISKMMENINPQKKAAKAARELNLEITKLANQSAGDKIAKVKELSLAYSKLGDNLNAKKQFVIDYKDELANMGIEMNNVNDADEIFVNNTNAYITALMARAKADALRQKATEDYKKGLDIIAEAEKKAVEAAQNTLNGINGGPIDKIKMLFGIYDLSTVGEDFTEAKRLMEDNFKSLFEQATKLDAEADKLLKKKKKSGGTGGGGESDAKKEAEERAKKQAEVLELFRTSQLTEEEKFYDNLEKQYQEYMELFKGDTEKQLLVVQWYTDEYTKLVEKELDERIKADEQIAKSAEETRKRISEADKQRYAEAVAASEKRLSTSFQNIDKETEKDVYTTERQKPEGKSELKNIDNELEKLLKLQDIFDKQRDSKVKAIEEEMKGFDVSSERWIELNNERIRIEEETDRTLLDLREQYNNQVKEKNKVIAQNTVSTFTSALSSASQIISALQEGIDTETKEGFEKNKKMQIANATIQMLTGIVNAISSSMALPQPWGAIQAAINAATVATVGGIQIANIKKQTFDGGGSGSVSTSVSPSLSLSDSMPIQYTRELVGDTEMSNMQQEQRVYVLESDITNTQNKVSVAENNSSF